MAETENPGTEQEPDEADQSPLARAAAMGPLPGIHDEEDTSGGPVDDVPTRETPEEEEDTFLGFRGGR